MKKDFLTMGIVQIHYKYIIDGIASRSKKTLFFKPVPTRGREGRGRGRGRRMAFKGSIYRIIRPKLAFQRERGNIEKGRGNRSIIWNTLEIIFVLRASIVALSINLFQ